MKRESNDGVISDYQLSRSTFAQLQYSRRVA